MSSFDGTPDKSSYYGAIYPGQVHVSDLFRHPSFTAAHLAAFDTGLSMFSAALDQWLPKFKSSNDPAPNVGSNYGGSSGDGGSNSSDGTHGVDGNGPGVLIRIFAKDYRSHAMIA
jgi:hypothetical protein